MDIFALSVLCCSLVLSLGYAWKQWFEKIYDGDLSWRYILCQIAHSITLYIILAIVFELRIWMFIIVVLVTIVGSAERAFDRLTDFLVEKGISLQWLRLVPMIGVIAITLLVMRTAHLSLSASIQPAFEWIVSSKFAGNNRLDLDQLTLGISCFILLAHPSNNLVKWFTGSRGSTSYRTLAGRETMLGAMEAATAGDNSDTARKSSGFIDLKAGHIIGILERWIIFTLVLAKQYSLIGLVLSAKTLTRFDNIQKDAAFGEYYLLGTLGSTFVALVIGIFMNQVMG